MTLTEIIKSRYKTNSYINLAERVSSFVGKTTEDKSSYYELILSKRFIPAGNTLLAGIDPIRPNCAILEPINENNYDQLSKRAVLLWNSRIGIGFDLSTSENPVFILNKLSELNAAIKLGHRPQRGNMAVLRYDHPKIKEFINCKVKLNNIYNFNLSVSVDSNLEDDNEVWDLIAEAAHCRGDPGVVFVDRLQGITGATREDLNIIHSRIGTVHTVVPCGEQGMYSDESCNLGSINLACPDFWTNRTFQSDIFEDSVRKAVRFLDDVIDLMEIPDPIIRAQNLNTRRIGLGIMGWADALLLNKIEYGSKQSLDLVNKIGFLFKNISHSESENLSIKGIAPILEGTSLKRRNLHITCIAPTGGISTLLSNKGYGIEPLFSVACNLSTVTHLEMQLKWQHYVDNCISKTVNIKNSSTPTDIKNVWIYAKNNNLKCVTVYRDGSHLNQPIQTYECANGKCDI